MMKSIIIALAMLVPFTIAKSQWVDNIIQILDAGEYQRIPLSKKRDTNTTFKDLIEGRFDAASVVYVEGKYDPDISYLGHSRR